MSWFTAGVQVNPATDAILADSGAAAAAGQTNVSVIIGGNVAMNVALEHRDAANAANIKSQIVASPANGIEQIDLPGLNYAAGEKFRLRLVAAVAGNVQGSILSF